MLVNCQEVTDLNFSDAAPELVIEGKVTNKPGPYFVKISLSNGFNDLNTSDPISEAIVKISDDLGNEEILVSSEPGIFQTTSIQGTIGVNYYLEVLYDDITYKASSFLGTVGKIDSLVSTFRPANGFREEGYYVSMYAQKSIDNQINYYRWLLYRDDQVFNGRDYLFVSSDEFAVDLRGVEFISEFELGDNVTVEMESLTKEAYDYFLQLNIILNSDGVTNRSRYTNPPSNFTPLLLGIFQASAVNTESIVIEK